MNTRSRKGFTLVETLVAVGLSGLLLAGVMSTFLMVARSSVRIARYQEMEQQSGLGLERLGRELRMARRIVAAGDPMTQITLSLPTVSGSTLQTVIYRYNADRRTFERTAGGRTDALIRNIVPGSFSFARFNLKQDPAANDYETNQIQVAMVASPDTRGLVAETSKRVISARYVLRNR